MLRNNERFKRVQEVFTNLKEKHLNPIPLKSLSTGRQA
jgi:hypothetical protein